MAFSVWTEYMSPRSALLTNLGLIYLLPFIALHVTYLSKMSSRFNIARITVIIKLFFVMEPPNSIAAILSWFVR